MPDPGLAPPTPHPWAPPLFPGAAQAPGDRGAGCSPHSHSFPAPSSLPFPWPCGRPGGSSPAGRRAPPPAPSPRARPGPSQLKPREEEARNQELAGWALGRFSPPRPREQMPVQVTPAPRPRRGQRPRAQGGGQGAGRIPRAVAGQGRAGAAAVAGLGLWPLRQGRGGLGSTEDAGHTRTCSGVLRGKGPGREALGGSCSRTGKGTPGPGFGLGLRKQ